MFAFSLNIYLYVLSRKKDVASLFCFQSKQGFFFIIRTGLGHLPMDSNSFVFGLAFAEIFEYFESMRSMILRGVM